MEQGRDGACEATYNGCLVNCLETRRRMNIIVNRLYSCNKPTGLQNTAFLPTKTSLHKDLSVLLGILF